jgi:hypothetical protein
VKKRYEENMNETEEKMKQKKQREGGNPTGDCKESLIRS